MRQKPRAIVLALMLGLFLLPRAPLQAAGPRSSPSSGTAGKLKLQRSSPPEIIETDIVTRQAYCKWAVKPPVLDGKLDETCWQDAAPIDQFAAYWAKPPAPRAGTKAYLVWDNDALYYGATMTDTELRSYGTKRNDTLWDGDVFELFFKPRLNKPAYYEFQANPKALVFEAAFAEKPGGDHTKFPALGSRAVITLNGTLDKPGDKDTGWTVEARIPWTAFAPTGGKPKPGDEWSFALCRYDYGPQGTKPTLMSSAPLTQPSFHRTQDYGKLRFDGPKVAERIERKARRSRDRE